jgi:hypothetical protein
MTAKAVIDLPGTESAIAVAQAPAANPQDERQALGVPISKQEMGAPAPRSQTEEEIPPPSSEKEAETRPELVVAPLVAASVSDTSEGSLPPVETKNEDPTPEPTVVIQADPEPTPAPGLRVEGQELVAPISKQEMGTEVQNEPTPEPSSQPTTVALLQEQVPEEKADPFVLQYGEILTLKGDSVWDTAARREVYYDPELYPLIVDANKQFLDPKYVFDDQVTLRFPTNATEEMKNQARRDAWTRKYQTLGGRRLIPWAYQRWLKNHDLPNNFQEK